MGKQHTEAMAARALTGLQEARVEALACQHGRTCVRAGFAGGVIEVVVPTGEAERIAPDGKTVQYLTTFSVDWTVAV